MWLKVLCCFSVSSYAVPAGELIVIWLVLDLMKRFGVLSIQSFALFFENMHNDMRGKDARLIAKTVAKVARALQLKSKYSLPSPIRTAVHRHEQASFMQSRIHVLAAGVIRFVPSISISVTGRLRHRIFRKHRIYFQPVANALKEWRLSTLKCEWIRGRIRCPYTTFKIKKESAHKSTRPF